MQDVVHGNTCTLRALAWGRALEQFGRRNGGTGFVPCILVFSVVL